MGANIRNNTTFLMKLVFIFAALVAVATAIPANTVVPEATLLSEEASYSEAAALLQKSGANACEDLAKATEDEVKKNIKAEQDLLDKMDKGSDCPSSGQDGVKAAEKEETRAKQAVKDAESSLNTAMNANVDWGSSKFNQVTKGQCGTFYTSNAYASAEKKANAAKTALATAQGKSEEATKAVAAAKEAAKKEVYLCQCKAFKAAQSAHASKSSSVASSNKDAWTKAAHLRCVLKGTSANNCKVPSMPTLSMPKMASGVSQSACNAHGSYGKFECTVHSSATNNAGVVKPAGKTAGATWALVMADSHATRSTAGSTVNRSHAPPSPKRRMGMAQLMPHSPVVTP